MTDRELLEQALTLVAKYHARETILVDWEKSVIAAISARIAEDDDEPVGYITYIEDAGILFTQDEPEHGVYETVYARPQTKARLTDEFNQIVYDIEQKIWEKNNG